MAVCATTSAHVNMAAASFSLFQRLGHAESSALCRSTVKKTFFHSFGQVNLSALVSLRGTRIKLSLKRDDVSLYLRDSRDSWKLEGKHGKGVTPGLSPLSLVRASTTQEGLRGPAATGPPPPSRSVVMVDVNPPRGTRDFPPEDMRLRTWLFDNFREVSRRFGFEEVDFPVLESEELFVRKAGEEITQQLYNFEDKGGRKVALRPELTPSLARLVLQKGKAVSFPLKWFAIGQCWRYERMTRGRRREHYQWNMDILGVAGVEAEAELLSAIVTFFTRLGLTSTDVGIRVSNRKVLQALLGLHNVPPESFASVCVIVDKMEKIPRSDVEKELAALGLSEEAIVGILGAMSVKTLSELRDLLTADIGAVEELQQLFALADAYGFSDWLVFDVSVVRGLAYYTGTVFEAFDREGKLRAICGGGRYDRLLSTFGGIDAPACGFGFGDAVIVELLKERNLLPRFPQSVDDIVVALDEDLRPQATALAVKLRASGRAVDLVLESKRLKWAFKQAERIGASRMIMLGATEWQIEAVRVKNLTTREESEVPYKEVS